ncbi:hypothetical protein NDU88_004851 [Pleurodeles waltl]|uniref:Uncharacterized protein n=1 Tax=Pleurodeles waltl TaxID=8319 RepID=A0AAV7QJ24_PLEWA|nr:hypothetical protein NDU88_004851 [Pleurodeles waltl]
MQEVCSQLWTTGTLRGGTKHLIGCDGASSFEAAPRYSWGTRPCAGGPGEPSNDEHADPEALLTRTGRTTDVRPSGLFKEPLRHSGRQRLEQDDVSWRPADAGKSEDRDQWETWTARNQEEACAEAGHALESMAIPDTAREEDREKRREEDRKKYRKGRGTLRRNNKKDTSNRKEKRREEKKGCPTNDRREERKQEGKKNGKGKKRD